MYYAGDRGSKFHDFRVASGQGTGRSVLRLWRKSFLTLEIRKTAMKRLAQALPLALLLALLVCLTSPFIYAQNNAGTIQGTVTDASGASVSAAVVKGKN